MKTEEAFTETINISREFVSLSVPFIYSLVPDFATIQRCVSFIIALYVKTCPNIFPSFKSMCICIFLVAGWGSEPNISYDALKNKSAKLRVWL